MMRFVLIFVPIILAAIGQLVLKTGMNQVEKFDLVRSFTNPIVLLGLGFYGASLILWMMVLTKENLSFVYPLVAFSYVVTVISSRIFLHEPVPSLRWVGLAVIVVGILLIAKSA